MLEEREAVGLCGAARFPLSLTEEPTVKPAEVRATLREALCPPDSLLQVCRVHIHTRLPSLHHKLNTLN